jgi:hypothetical protein
MRAKEEETAAALRAELEAAVEEARQREQALEAAASRRKALMAEAEHVSDQTASVIEAAVLESQRWVEEARRHPHAPELAAHIDFMAKTMATCGHAALEPNATVVQRCRASEMAAICSEAMVSYAEGRARAAKQRASCLKSSVRDAGTAASCAQAQSEEMSAKVAEAIAVADGQQRLLEEAEAALHRACRCARISTSPSASAAVEEVEAVRSEGGVLRSKAGGGPRRGRLQKTHTSARRATRQQPRLGGEEEEAEEGWRTPRRRRRRSPTPPTSLSDVAALEHVLTAGGSLAAAPMQSMLSNPCKLREARGPSSPSQAPHQHRHHQHRHSPHAHLHRAKASSKRPPPLTSSSRKSSPPTRKRSPPIRASATLVPPDTKGASADLETLLEADLPVLVYPYNDLLVRTRDAHGAELHATVGDDEHVPSSIWMELLARCLERGASPLFLQMDGAPADVDALIHPRHRLWLYGSVGDSFAAFHLGGASPAPRFSDRINLSTQAMYTASDDEAAPQEDGGNAAPAAEQLRRVRILRVVSNRAREAAMGVQHL